MRGRGVERTLLDYTIGPGWQLSEMKLIVNTSRSVLSVIREPEIAEQRYKF